MDLLVQVYSDLMSHPKPREGWYNLFIAAMMNSKNYLLRIEKDFEFCIIIIVV